MGWTGMHKKYCVILANLTLKRKIPNNRIKLLPDEDATTVLNIAEQLYLTYDKASEYATFIDDQLKNFENPAFDKALYSLEKEISQAKYDNDNVPF